jgi:hypothetical protein
MVTAVLALLGGLVLAVVGAASQAGRRDHAAEEV